MINPFHIHHWAKPEGRYQTCTKCGIVRAIECAHEWETESSYEHTHQSHIHGVLIGEKRTVGEFQILKCKRCGEKKSLDFKI